MICKKSNEKILSSESGEKRWNKIFQLASKIKRCGDDTECGGCTDQDALNYDSNATFNNGSCEYNPDDYWQLDVALLTEDTWCVNNEHCPNPSDSDFADIMEEIPEGSCECNDYNDNEQDCTENGGSFCEWNGTFEAKVGFPIYWINTSEFDIEVYYEIFP